MLEHSLLRLALASAALAACCTACGGGIAATGIPDDAGADAALPGSDGGADDGGGGNDGRPGDGDAGDGGCSLPPPTQHRPTHVGCDKTRPPGVNADAGLTGGSCWSDSQCNNPDAGTNGRCTPTGRLGSPFCLYDMCSTDVECPGSDVCSCGGPAAGPGRYPNECLASNCRVDSDCGPGAFCSPSLFCSGGTVGGYFCHSSCDECTNDSQCPSSGSIPGYCGWQPQVGRWACAVGPCPAG